eukprot:CAMPEP_0118934220 /NCGR_PEP_ID=MMETSP1169-20130426/13704_1 /TAXON_ID=36882 /ORGANISM="Pyramimonas obovata, Strain CCMP722" /LENGTH=120 /DNA_ID=CAMNT_0006877097 /DNA_START=298 /DNA_END=657 /DNA_ORIENTATION=+
MSGMKLRVRCSPHGKLTCEKMTDGFRDGAGAEAWKLNTNSQRTSVEEASVGEEGCSERTTYMLHHSTHPVYVSTQRKSVDINESDPRSPRQRCINAVAPVVVVRCSSVDASRRSSATEFW